MRADELERVPDLAGTPNLTLLWMAEVEWHLLVVHPDVPVVCVDLPLELAQLPSGMVSNLPPGTWFTPGEVKL